MSKKKNNEPKKMTAAQYWEWRCSIEEIKVAKLNEKKAHLENEILNKDIENKKLKLVLFKESARSARSSVLATQEDFEQTKQRIEKELGISLKDCTIDPYTYEIKPINEDE